MAFLHLPTQSEEEETVQMKQKPEYELLKTFSFQKTIKKTTAVTLKLISPLNVINRLEIKAKRNGHVKQVEERKHVGIHSVKYLKATFFQSSHRNRSNILGTTSVQSKNYYYYDFFLKKLGTFFPFSKPVLHNRSLPNSD